MGRVTVAHRVHRLAEANHSERIDTLAAEEPLELMLDGETVMVTMRTPGHDFDLVAGLLVAEGVIGSPEDLRALRYCPRLRAGEDERYNTVEAVLAPGVVVPESALARVGYTTSACGVCGKTSIDAVCSTTRWPVADDPLKLEPATLYRLPETLRSAQRVFDRTGGLHAAGVFTPDGTPLYVREDVGRHNAVDKVIGAALRDGLLPLREHILAVSGRTSFELVQKAVAAGIPALVAVSAPSALAVKLAEESGLTLAGFVRGTTANVYTRADRVV